MRGPIRFSTAEVALILHAEEWRIKNFALPAYGIESSVKAKGRGHRTVYGYDVLLRLVVANELYEACLSAEGIKAADAELQEQRAIEKWTGSFDRNGESRPLLLLLSERRNKQTGKRDRVWKILTAKQAASEHDGFVERSLVSVCLNISALWESTVQRITELQGEGKI